MRSVSTTRSTTRSVIGSLAGVEGVPVYIGGGAGTVVEGAAAIGADDCLGALYDSISMATTPPGSVMESGKAIAYTNEFTRSFTARASDARIEGNADEAEASVPRGFSTAAATRDSMRLATCRTPPLVRARYSCAMLSAVSRSAYAAKRAVSRSTAA